LTDRTASGAQQGREVQDRGGRRRLGVWLGSWGYSRTTSHGAPIMPQCQLTVLGLTWCRTTSRLALAAPQADFGASCRPAQREEQSRMSWLWLVRSSHLTHHCHWRVRRSSQHLRALRFSSPHPTSIPPHHAHAHAHPRPQDLPERISKARRQFKLSRYNPSPVASILSPGERRHRRLTAHIFLSSLALRLDPGPVRPG
jgi:hypothetical protein